MGNVCSSGPQGGLRQGTDYLRLGWHSQVWRSEWTQLLQSQASEPKLRALAWPSPMDQKAQVKINRKRWPKRLHSPKLRWGGRLMAKKRDRPEPAGALLGGASSQGQVVEESSGLVTRGPRQERREPSRAAGRTSLLLRENYSLPPSGSKISVSTFSPRLPSSLVSPERGATGLVSCPRIPSAQSRATRRKLPKVPPNLGEQRRRLTRPRPSFRPDPRPCAYRLRVAAVDGGADGGSLALGPAVHLVDDPVHLGARQTVEQHRGGTGGAGGAAPPREGLPPASAAGRSRR